MKEVVAAFNQEKALSLVGAFSVITNLRMELFEALAGIHGEVRIGYTILGDTMLATSPGHCCL